MCWWKNHYSFLIKKNILGLDTTSSLFGVIDVTQGSFYFRNIRKQPKTTSYMRIETITENTNNDQRKYKASVDEYSYKSLSSYKSRNIC